MKRSTTYVDLTLEELGVELRQAHMIEREAKRKIRELEAEQQARIKQIMKMRHIEFVVDDDGRNVIVTEPQNPSAHQREVLGMFEQALVIADEALLTTIYTAASNWNCAFTTWTSEFGESLDVAYARRMAELKQEAGATAA